VNLVARVVAQSPRYQQQRRCDKREAVASAAADKALKAHKREREEEQDLVKAA
jgi:hypothetical protein